jgi:hypothetical protein
MKKEKINSLIEYLSKIPNDKGDIYLFRGQRQRKDLLPKIARPDKKVDTQTKEKEMISELRRQGTMLLNHYGELDDWELLVVAQHFGMMTRLLDWTSNPLAALWFACENLDNTSSSFVYLLMPNKTDFLDKAKCPTPFSAKRTLVLKPNLNNPRIMAQHGWFTAHMFSNSLNKWVALNNNKLLTKKLIELEIPGSMKDDLLTRLDKLGINKSTLFADIEGLCGYINWLHS